MALRLRAKAQLLLRGLRYAGLLPHLEIDGTLHIDEAVALYDLASALPQRDAVAVQLGCETGQTSLVLATALKPHPGSTLYCVHPSPSGPPDAFLENLRMSGVLVAIKNLSGVGRDLARQFSRSIDLLVFGRESDYETLSRDFLIWSPLLRPGGMVCLHGVDSVLEGPRRVVAAQLGNRRIWDEGELVGELYLARRVGRDQIALGATAC